MVVAFAIAVDNVQSLTRMCVKEMELVRTVRDGLHLGPGLGMGGQPAGENERQEKEFANISSRPGQVQASIID